MQRNRVTLKGYFQKGTIPTQSNFVDLIDSLLSQEDDGVSKTPNDPLSIKAVGADEGLINFYRVEQAADTLTWQLKQKPGGRSGLSIHDAVGDSRLFIESGTGNVGIGAGTTAPYEKLSVEGRISFVDGKRVWSLGASLPDGTRGNDPETGTPAPATFAIRDRFEKRDRLVIDGAGNVGIGTDAPGAKLEVRGTAPAGGTLGVLVIGGNDFGFFGVRNRGATGDADAYDAIIQWGDNRADNLVLVNYDYGQGETEVMRVNGNGNVGIGTDAPGAKLEVKGGVTILEQEEWKTADLINGWKYYAVDWNTAGYFKDSQGVVHLKGLVKDGEMGVAIFTLPAGYRPAKRELQATLSNDKSGHIPGRIDVTTDGQVIAVDGNSHWISLDGITFRAA